MDISTHFNTVGTAFKSSFDYIMLNGHLLHGTKAVYNAAIEIKHPSVIDFPEWRKFKLDYAEYEYEWYKSGNRSVSEIGERAKIWKSIADKDGNVWSNYGYHWLENNQLNKVINLLKEDPRTRRAVVLHYDYYQMDNYNHDTPCNLALNFFIRNGKLNMTVFARSIDLVYGFCNDFFCFSKLLSEVANKLNVNVDSLTFFITNLHIYERHFSLKSKHKINSI